MYLYGKRQDVRPGDANAEQDSDHGERRTSPLGPTTLTVPPPSTSVPLSAVQISQVQPSEPGSRPRRSSHTVNIPFPPLFQPNASSTSLASSTAEGKPIPLDDTTADHRTSALQKLNSTYPSEVRRHRYAKSAGAQSTTYSQPVLVRTYTGLPPPQTSHGGRGPRYRPSSSSRGGSRRVPMPMPVSSRQSTAHLSSKPIQPVLSGVGNSSSSNEQQACERLSRASGQGMSRHKSTKSTGSLPLPLPLPMSLPWQWTSSSGRPDHDEARLPPLEAFAFKSIMADVQARGGDGSIGADLDRIAEICARSRYSLSNQYEVHVAPHGSGQSFLINGSVPSQRRKSHGGPTLQAFNSDDDDSVMRSHRKRRSGGRRKSVAYGTLETIMSSSRSSEEDKSKKKPAAEITSEVRGRASRKNWDSSTGSGSKSGSTGTGVESHGRLIHKGHTDEQSFGMTLARKKSASFATAIIDNGRSVGKHEIVSALVSEPALPQTSNTNLGVRTAPGLESSNSHGSRAASPDQQIEVHLADDLPHQEGTKASPAGWSTWIPWRQKSQRTTDSSPNRTSTSFAAGSLRQLLKSADVHPQKGKAVDREGYMNGD